jgi:hypothetical protein
VPGDETTSAVALSEYRRKPPAIKHGDESRAATAANGHGFRFCSSQAEWSDMDPQSICKSYNYKLRPTPQQERTLDRTLMLCHHVYNAAVGERREARRKCGISVGYY